MLNNSTPPSLADHVLAVAFVFGADVLLDLIVGREFGCSFDDPRFDESVRILDGELNVQVTQIEAAKAFRDVHFEKGTEMAAKWHPAGGAVRSEPFPLIRRRCSERPGAVKGAPLLGAAKRTLDGEDRSEKITEEGKAGAKAWRKVGRHSGTLARRL